MKYFRITTPTPLDIREIVTLGLTTKGDGTRIGHKGSGLKFTMAYLHRLGGFIEARGQGYHLKSETTSVTIRDCEHQILQLRSQTNDGIWETHMTTGAGADSWIEPWFILRELIQNAIDEGGSYGITEEATIPETDGTIMQVPLIEQLASAWEERDQWMQPRYPGIVGIGHPSVKGLYFHGFLVYRATQPWTFSFDVTGTLRRSELSEDRQLLNADLGNIFHRIAEHMAFDFQFPLIYKKGLEPEPSEDIVKIFEGVYSLIDNSKKEWGGTPGFKLSKLVGTFQENHGRMAAFTTAAISEADPNIYYARAAGYTPVTVSHRISNILSGYSDVTSVRACLPTLTNRLKKMKTVDISRGEKLKAALRLLRKIKPEGIKVEIVAKIMADDTINCKAVADPANNRILVLESLLDEEVSEIARVLIEEFAHITSGGGDMSLELQRSLVNTIYELLTRNRKMNVENIQT
jgi:hypothetical protein